jgi:EF hand
VEQRILKLKKTFEIFDKDRNGTISINELKQVISRRGSATKYQRAQCLLPPDLCTVKFFIFTQNISSKLSHFVEFYDEQKRNFSI